MLTRVNTLDKLCMTLDQNTYFRKLSHLVQSNISQSNFLSPLDLQLHVT